MMPPRGEIAAHWLCDLHWDLGETTCWACGLWDGSEWDGAYDEAAWLERCHLVPESLGGPNCSDNLVLLYERCHREMPNVDDRAGALEWIRTHKERTVDRLVAEVRRLCPDAEERLARVEPTAFVEARECRREEAIVHFGEGRMSEATFAWIYAQALMDAT